MTVVNKIISILNDQHLVSLVMCDVSKAFDSVEHATLFIKLENYGIRGFANDLLHSY